MTVSSMKPRRTASPEAMESPSSPCAIRSPNMLLLANSASAWIGIPVAAERGEVHDVPLGDGAGGAGDGVAHIELLEI